MIKASSLSSSLVTIIVVVILVIIMSIVIFIIVIDIETYEVAEPGIKIIVRPVRGVWLVKNLLFGS